MPCTVTWSEARDNFRETINRAHYRNERVVICSRKREVAALVPMEDVELLERLEDMIDLKVALEALRDVERHGTMSLAKFREQLGV
jgi:prevent-host-death family protein